MRFGPEGQRRHPCPDFAGLVPASRGVHCHPLHPRLASSLFATVWLLHPQRKTHTKSTRRIPLEPPAKTTALKRRRPVCS
jgi:hypothetical protein